jgi:predicted TIM-barrel fold metal-dependent hydrolase
MAIVLHLRPSVTRQRPYGERIARIFLTEVIPEAPDVPIQIAHMAGAGLLNDPPADEALLVFVKAIAENDARMRNVYFDVSGISGVGRVPEISARLATRIRQLGIRRILFGSDAAVRGNSPLFSLTAFRKVPLSKSELTSIEENVPPYLK